MRAVVKNRTCSAQHAAQHPPQQLPQQPLRPAEAVVLQQYTALTMHRMKAVKPPMASKLSRPTAN